MKRVSFFAYGLACYLMFLGVFLYAVPFIGNFLVPKTLDAGGFGWPMWAAVVVNVGLLVAFGVQHSVMARPTFKRWWLRFVPEPIERATYVLATNLCLIAAFILWQPMPALVWDAQGALARGAMWAMFAFGWATVLITTLLINHFDLFGLRQVWLHLLGRPYTRVGFKKPVAYRVVRHPLYVGWIMAFWATPTMTVGHLLFALGLTAYILIAIRFEERNLVEEHGESYAAYRRSTPMLIPGLRPRATRRDVAQPAPEVASS
jgi:protein-S-isoprenylcysteine O-methyltransferase Ste14